MTEDIDEETKFFTDFKKIIVQDLSLTTMYIHVLRYYSDWEYLTSHLSSYHTGTQHDLKDIIDKITKDDESIKKYVDLKAQTQWYINATGITSIRDISILKAWVSIINYILKIREHVTKIIRGMRIEDTELQYSNEKELYVTLSIFKTKIIGLKKEDVYIFFYDLMRSVKMYGFRHLFDALTYVIVWKDKSDLSKMFLKIFANVSRINEYDYKNRYAYQIVQMANDMLHQDVHTSIKSELQVLASFRVDASLSTFLQDLKLPKQTINNPVQVLLDLASRDKMQLSRYPDKFKTFLSNHILYVIEDPTLLNRKKFTEMIGFKSVIGATELPNTSRIIEAWKKGSFSGLISADSSFVSKFISYVYILVYGM